MIVLFLGGPNHGEQIKVPEPLPDPYPVFEPAEPVAWTEPPADRQVRALVEYELRWVAKGSSPYPRPAYVAPGYDGPMQL